MNRRDIADIGVVLYIFLLIAICASVGAPGSHAPRAEQHDSNLVAAASGFRAQAPEK